MKINKTENLHKHIKGSYKDYDPEVHKNAIYFAEDEEQIIVDDIEYGGSNYWYDVKEREEYLVLEITTTEETDTVEFADFYKVAQILPYMDQYDYYKISNLNPLIAVNTEEFKLPEKAEYFIDWGDGQTELFKSNTDDIPQEVIDIIQRGEFEYLDEVLELLEGSILSHTYNDKKEYTIKIYIYNPDLYKDYTMTVEEYGGGPARMSVQSINYSIEPTPNSYYPNSVLLNLNCEPKLVKYYGINNKLFPITFNTFPIYDNKVKLILDNEITEILDVSLGRYIYEFTGELKLPEGITIIGDSAFRRCSGFTGELILPESLKIIGDYAFYNCPGLTGDLIIPESVTSIGNDAFNSCRGLSKIYVCEDTELGQYWNSNTPAEVIKYKKGETPWLEK